MRYVCYFMHVWNCDSSTGYSVPEIGKSVITYGNDVLYFYM